MSSAPVILTQPVSLTTNAGTSADFFIAMTSVDAGFSYVWYKNGTNIITGATTSNYLNPSCASSDVGTYSCRVSNSAGLTNSTAATLTVRFTPQFYQTPPVTQTILEGASVTLTANVLAVPAANFVWQLNGTNIASTATNAYSVTNARQANQGTYTILASNAVGFSTASSYLNVESPVETDTAQPYPFQPPNTFPDSGGMHRQFGTSSVPIAGTEVFIKIMSYIENGSMEAFILQHNSRRVSAGPPAADRPQDMVMMSWSAWNILNNGKQPFIATTYPKKWLAAEGGGRLPSLVGFGLAPGYPYQWNIVYVGTTNTSQKTLSSAVWPYRANQNPSAVIIPLAMQNAMA